MAHFLFPETELFLPQEKDFLEAARYIGYSKFTLPDEKIFAMIKNACEKLILVLKPQAVFQEFPLEVVAQNKEAQNDELYKISFAGLEFFSKDLGRNLHGCSSVYLMAATVGPQVDNVIRREQNVNPAMAAVLQGAGAMFIEKLVDYVNAKIKEDAEKQGKTIKPRYSPGYGDVPLDMQKNFFSLLPCTRIGLTLMDTLIMAPEKSVTAFIGSRTVL